ncbi:MAG: DNA polymerase III subunit beta [Treponema sp.]|jgi:DNA polymerase-3 subunit beta|nr:DNA polymerase III subunit beta [Treponema sp.]
MKFTCERSVLLKEIGIAQEIVASKNAFSILSNIYIETLDDSLIIKATDIKVSFETKVPVNVIESGSTTVFCDKFLGVLNALPDGEVEFEQIDSNLVIKTPLRKLRYNLKSIASDSFPQFPELNEDNFFSIPVKDFKDMIQQTVFAVSDDETRYFMTGVLLERIEDKLNMVATDGRRLALIKKSVGDAVPPFAPVIVPPKILNIIMKRAGDEGLISIAVTERYIFVRFGLYNLSSVLIEGQFPNYHRVIPENQENVFSVNRLELLDALRRVVLLVEKSKRVYFELAPGVLSIASEESDFGAANEEIPCRYDGEKLSIAMNYHYIEEPFKVMSEEEISIKFTDTVKAITIHPDPDPQSDFLHIVMPMQP